MTLNSEQRAAVDVRRNAVVSAGAGSGKTRVLTERFVDIVRRGEARADEILALTFTRKAAGEMAERIQAALPAAGAHDDEEPSVMTLDAFCGQVLRDAAIRFGLPDTIISDDEVKARLIEREAWSFIVTEGDAGPLADLIVAYGVGTVVDTVLVPFAVKYARIERDGHLRDAWPAIRSELEREQAAMEATIEAYVAEIESLELGVEQNAEIRRGVIAADDDPAALAAYLDRAPAPARGKRDGEEADRLREALAGLRGKHTKPGKGGVPKDSLLGRWRLIEATLQAEEFYLALWDLLERFEARLARARRTTGAIDFEETMALAINALRDDAELRRYWSQRFRFIMVDEFQDNNAAQRDLLFLLASTPEACSVPRVPAPSEIRPDVLFFVGDQKQSIFRFRGARVDLFRRLADEMEARLELRRNYRSAPEILAFVNALFAHLFDGAQTDHEPLEPDPDWETRDDVQRKRSRLATAPLGAEASRATVTLAIYDGDAGESPGGESDPADLEPPKYAEAYWIAERIAEEIAAGTPPRDIAILLRAGTDSHVIERALRTWQIPYASDAIRSLYQEAPAADLYALLRVALVPEDRAATAALLRSPLAAVGDDLLIRLMGRDDGEAPLAPLASLDDADAERLAALAALVERVRLRIDRESLTDTIRSVWFDEGYRYALLARPEEHAYLEHLDVLLDVARRFEQRPAIEFVEFLSRQLGKFEKVEAEGSDSEAVRIMTIHKSKGLEFPVVFLAQVTTGRAKTPGGIYDREGVPIVPLPGRLPGDPKVDYFNVAAKEAERDADYEERMRLLYVATTRAEHRLYITGAIGSRDPWEESIYAMIDGALTPTFDGERVVRDGAPFTSVRIDAIPRGTTPAARVRQRAGRSRDDVVQLLDDPRTTTPADREWPPFHTTPSGENEAAVGDEPYADGASDAAPLQDGAPSSAEREAALLLGTLAHRAVEVRTDAAVAPTRAEWLSAPPWVIGTIRGATPELLEEAWNLSEAFLTSPLWREIEAAQRAGSARVEHEVRFVLALDRPERPREVRGTIDLLVRWSDRVTVVDFKSDRDLEPDHYRAQMEFYRRAATALERGVPVTVVLFALRTGEAIEVVAE